MADRWLSYQRLGKLFGMSAEAARQRARRLGWRTQPGNDGRKLVLVPDDVIIHPRVRTPVQTTVQTPDLTGQLTALRTLVGVLQDQLATATAEALYARQQLDREQHRADVAEDGIVVLEARLAAATEAARAAEADAALWRINADDLTGLFSTPGLQPALLSEADQRFVTGSFPHPGTPRRRPRDFDADWIGVERITYGSTAPGASRPV